MSIQLLPHYRPTARPGAAGSTRRTAPSRRPSSCPSAPRPRSRASRPTRSEPPAPQIILGNTYHLALRPGDELIAELGGLHRFMDWDGPILTDSGGFQVFSLAQIRKITDDGAVVPLAHRRRAARTDARAGRRASRRTSAPTSPWCLDECPPADAPEPVMRDAVRRTILWAERCRDAHTRADQALFAIVQGGTDLDWRRECAEPLVAMDFPGYALGGFSVGESPEQCTRPCPRRAALLPANKPRYLMGVGRPEDLLAGVAAGHRPVRLRACRPATAATPWPSPPTGRPAAERLPPARSGPARVRLPLLHLPNFSRAYLHHLFPADEMLGPTLLSLHNVAFYLRLMADARRAIEEGRFAAFRAGCLARWAASHLG